MICGIPYLTKKVIGAILHDCAAKAIFYCPSMNSHRPRSQNTAKGRTLIPEKDSTRKRPRSHVSLENHQKTISRWNIEPNQTSSLTSLHSRPTIWQLFSAGLPRGEARTARISCCFHQTNKLAKGRGEGGVNRGLI